MEIRVKVTTSGSGGFELPPARPVAPEVPPARLLVLPSGSRPAQVGNFTFKGGRYTVKKSPGATLLYGVDLREVLHGVALTGATIDSTRGVAAAAPFIRGTVIGVMIDGLAQHEGAVNYCVLKYTCADGQSDTVAIGFEKS